MQPHGPHFRIYPLYRSKNAILAPGGHTIKSMFSRAKPAPTGPSHPRGRGSDLAATNIRTPKKGAALKSGPTHVILGTVLKIS